MVITTDMMLGFGVAVLIAVVVWVVAAKFSRISRRFDELWGEMDNRHNQVYSEIEKSKTQIWNEFSVVKKETDSRWDKHLNKHHKTEE